MASAVLFTLPLNADTLSLSIYIHSLTYALYTSLLKFGIKIDLVQQMCVPMERGTILRLSLAGSTSLQFH
jgi:hypothetical protein